VNLYFFQCLQTSVLFEVLFWYFGMCYFVMTLHNKFEVFCWISLVTSVMTQALTSVQWTTEVVVLLPPVTTLQVASRVPVHLDSPKTYLTTHCYVQVCEIEVHLSWQMFRWPCVTSKVHFCYFKAVDGRNLGLYTACHVINNTRWIDQQYCPSYPTQCCVTLSDLWRSLTSQPIYTTINTTNFLLWKFFLYSVATWT